MSTRLKNALTAATILISGFSAVLIWRIYQVQQIIPEPFIPQKLDFKLQPPISALTGKITENKGEVKKRGREDKDFSPINAATIVLEGESFATVNGSLSLDFGNFGKIDLQPNSEISLANLIPDQFLIVQQAGTVTYQLLNQDKTLTVRSLHLLITIISGSSRVSTEKAGRITVEILSGNSKIAYVDTENKTQVLELISGKAIFDDATRTVILK